jgi:hypothetical protein
VLRTGVFQNFDVSTDGKGVVMFPRPAAETSSGSLHATFLLNFLMRYGGEYRPQDRSTA